jgi:hypothetical protein
MIMQKEMKIEEQLEAMKSLTDKHACLENEISEMRIVMESTREGLKKEQAKNDMKDSTIEELNEKVCRISEEKMRLKSENDRSIEEKELSKKVADEICEMRIVMESTAAGLQKEKLNNDIKDSKIEELNEKVSRISDEKMRMKNENDKSIKDLELSKRKTEDEHLSQQEVAKKTIWELEEAMSLQQ